MEAKKLRASEKRPAWLPPINGAAILGPLIIAASVSDKFVYEDVSSSGGVGTLAVSGLILVTVAIAIAEYARWEIPVLSRAADLVLDRTINSKANWENDTLRSMIETACWLHLTMLLHTATRNMLFSAPAGGLCGLLLVIAGDLCTTSLRQAERLLFKTNAFRSLKLPASLTEIISLGSVLVFCVFFRLGNEMRNTMGSCALATLSLVILAQGLMQMPPTTPSWKIGKLIHHRMTRAGQNWIDHPLRSFVESASVVSITLLIHWLVDDAIASAVLGSLAGILIILVVEHMTTRRSGGSSKSSLPSKKRTYFSRACQLDHRLSHSIFKAASKSSALKVAAEAFSFLVDDATCLLVLIISWLVVLYKQNQGTWLSSLDSPSPHCTAEAIVEGYLIFMPWSAIETAVKLLVRSPRPAYGKQKKLQDVVIPGDQFSWPSGHSLRAFGMARAPFLSSALQRMGWALAPTPSLQASLLLLALLSGWSRVALGKHSLVDVISGATLGLLWFPVLEGLGSDNSRFGLQMACACYYTLVTVAAMCSGRVRRFLGFVDPDQPPFFSATIVWGTWMYCLGRFDGASALGHHDFQRCGVGPDLTSLWVGQSGPWPAAVAAAALACSFLYPAVAGVSRAWRLFLLPALCYAALALELTGSVDLGILSLLRPPSLVQA